MKVIIKAIYMMPDLRKQFKLPAHRGKRVITRGSISWSKLLEVLRKKFFVREYRVNYETDEFHGIRAVPVFRQEEAFQNYIQSLNPTPNVIMADEIFVAIEEITQINLQEITSNAKCQSSYIAGQLLAHFANSSVSVKVDIFNALAKEANELLAKIFKKKAAYKAPDLKGDIVEIQDGRTLGIKEATELARELLERVKSIKANLS